MDLAKKEKIGQSIILLFLVLFPFGQLFRFNFSLAGFTIPLQAIDVVAVGALGFVFLSRIKKYSELNGFTNFLIIALFSLVLSTPVFGKGVLIGGLYFFRLLIYSSFFGVCLNLISNNPKLKLKLLNSLIIIAFFVGLFGWIQYFIFPDFRPFKIWGWDDHLFRLVGTFLDPGFTGIFLVFGSILGMVKAFESKDKKFWIVLIFLIITLAFTYSRASYLAFLAGFLVISYFLKRLKYFLLILVAFLFLLNFLPRPAGEGVKLERIFSVISRVENYQQGLVLWGKSPLFGLGYNNLCLGKEKYLGDIDKQSHACSGLDSSLLLVLVTTGVSGLIVFLEFLLSLWRKTSNNSYGLVFKASLAALMIHSLFVNSLFYPWVIGWLAILLSLALVKAKEKNGA